MKKTISALAVAAITAVPMMAQEARVGVSQPDQAPIAATQEDATAGQTVVKQKPSAAIQAAPVKSQETEYGAYVPYAGAKTTTPVAAVVDEDRADGEVVTSVVDRPGELREGTLLRARLEQKLSSATTEPGTRFSATLTEPVEKDGRVVMPIGSVVRGRVTTVHGGRRISGAALIHLEADSVVLPDGTRYNAHLQLIDTDQLNHTKIDREGSLVRRDHPKETLAAVGLATGGAAAAGAAIGGGVGAAVGAGIGAGAGTVVWLKQDRQEVVPAQSMLVFSLATAMPLVPQSAISESHPPVIHGNPDGMVVGDR